MRFISTRGKDEAKCASEAIVRGLCGDGGLFVPESFPDLTDKLIDMLSMDYPEISATVIGSYLTEYDFNDLLNATKKAYAKFEDNNATPVVKIDDNLFILELFHGPTLAFKDIALTILPYLLRKGADYCGVKEEILILVATSGDTGKAALEGFKDAEGIKINVFFPVEGVSDMQKKQMCTQEGNNVNVVAIKGNFDDCQTAVKKIFNDKKVNEKLKEKGVVLSSANSINFGRLVPQIAYYFSSYCDLVNSNEIKLGDKVDFVVPTGNFGNILAGFYAKKMGLPINKLICASNENNVLTEFFTTGDYDKNREFFKTMSPSMDILVSSNLERFIFELSNRDSTLTASRMQDLTKLGEYKLTKNELNLASKEFLAGFTDEEECSTEIENFFDDFGYVLDTHTAVAMNVFEKIGDKNIPSIILSTASPYKFPQSVYKSITGKKITDPFKAAESLNRETAAEIPEQISKLKDKEIRFTSVCEKDKALDAILQFISK